jgi:prophage regulatory protein
VKRRRRATARKAKSGRQPQKAHSAATPPADTLLMTTEQVLKAMCVSRTWLWHERRAGRFPAPVQLGRFSIRWRRADIENWIASRQGQGAAA